MASEEKEEARKSTTLFDYLSDITYGKQYKLEEDDSKAYVPFMINRGLGQHIDCIMLANEMNKRPNISKLMHHDFLFHSVDSKKRYGKWAKADDTDSDIIEFVMQHYLVNREIAIEYMSLLDRDDIKQMKLKSELKGGRKR